MRHKNRKYMKLDKYPAKIDRKTYCIVAYVWFRNRK